MKNNFLKFAATLFIICLAASGLLSVVHRFTLPKIIEQAQAEESQSLKDVFPQAKSFEPVKKGDDVFYYKALDDKNAVLGYAFKASRRGYSSDIVTMVGMGPDGVIRKIKILSQNETPGLGTRVTEVIQKETLWDVLLKKVQLKEKPEPWFQAQFSGQKVETLASSVDAISGATITSQAVIVAVQGRAGEVMEMVRHESR
ncbi:MAG: FMN-binding protein [Candidatus Omnitrophica bacterium]|nr:FMN-binding protein [Candidatus Omnitrophota bacterium]MDD5574565.1 FMN-binding protein [Candidatus Omnitrophota bacterium]